MLMPCSQCCSTSCTCTPCQCCECSGKWFSDFGPPYDDRSDLGDYTIFMSGPISNAARGELLDLDVSPCDFYTEDFDRYFTSVSYDRIRARWPKCQIRRRWPSQSGCVDSLIDSEVAAILANGEPYSYDPWYGKCVVPVDIDSAVTVATNTPGGSPFTLPEAARATATVSSHAGCTISVAVTDGGTGYAYLDTSFVFFDMSGGSGTGAQVSVGLTGVGYLNEVAEQSRVWGASESGQAVTAGGTGYVDGESITLTTSALTGFTVVELEAAEATINVTAGAVTSVNVTNPGRYYAINNSARVGTLQTWAYDSRGSTTYAGRKYNVTIDSDENSATFGQVTGITYTAAENFGTGTIGATPTSSLPAEVREWMLEGFCPHKATPPAGFGGFWAPLKTYGGVTFADEDEVREQIEALYGAGGGLDATTNYRGYCAEWTLMASGLNPPTVAKNAPVGWSAPYRNGEPLTIEDMKGLCNATANQPTVPWKERPDAGEPTVFGAIGTSYFTNADKPEIKAVILNDTTGDEVLDDLIATGTVGALESGSSSGEKYWHVCQDQCGSSPSCGSFAGDYGHYFDDFKGASQPYPGKKMLQLRMYSDDGSLVLFVFWTACANPDPGDYEHAFPSYYLFHTVGGVETDVSHLITSSLDIRPYTSQADCETAALYADCSNNLWKTWINQDELSRACCPAFNYTLNDFSTFDEVE